MSHKPPRWLWQPLASGLALLLPALAAAVTHRLLLFASLAPTAVLAVQQPSLPSVRPYNAFVGHMGGLLAGYLMVFAFGLASTPSVFVLHAVSPARAAAALCAIVIAAALELLLRAQHPPAASTTLLVALGSFHANWSDAGSVIGGVAAVTIGAELVRRWCAGRLLGSAP